jgi:hypothetical protein
VSENVSTAETSIPDASTAASSPAPASAPAETTATPPSSDGTTAPAPSSGDTPRSDDRAGLLAAVREVVQPKTDSDDETAVPGQDKEAAGKAGIEQDTAAQAPATQTDGTQTAVSDTDPTEAELKRLKPETRRRFERLLQQRDEARTQLTQAEPELAQHRQLQGYLREHELAPDDVNMLLGVGACLRRGDFKGFLAGVMPYVQASEEALGLRLPPDLQQQVNDGLVSEAAAKELIQTRHRAHQAEFRVQQDAEVRGRQSQEQQVLTVRQTIDNWEAETRRKDPDYPAKAAAVRRIGQALLQERGAPRTAEEARSLVQAAYDEATTMLVKARPAPQPTRRTPSGIHGTTAPGAHEPKTPMEVARAALAQMHGAS